MNTSKGFVTLAVGNERYYRLAANLLKSYKLRVKNHYPFAIFADRHNEYTALFDKVVIIDNPSFSYNDKLELLNNPPFTYNIFIDADCLVYGDINSYWEYYIENSDYRTGVRCFGKSLPLTSHDGWFKIEDVGEYKNSISFIPQMHGGIIFFTNDAQTRLIYQYAKDIAEKYSKYKFKYFDAPADEPILALCMAITNTHPIQLEPDIADKAFCFYPTTKMIRSRHGSLSVKYSDRGGVDNVKLLHWQNINTLTPLYKIEVDKLRISNPLTLFVLYKFYQISFYIDKQINRIIRKAKTICKKTL